MSRSHSFVTRQLQNFLQSGFYTWPLTVFFSRLFTRNLVLSNAYLSNYSHACVAWLTKLIFLHSISNRFNFSLFFTPYPAAWYPPIYRDTGATFAAISQSAPSQLETAPYIASVNIQPRLFGGHFCGRIIEQTEYGSSLATTIPLRTCHHRDLRLNGAFPWCELDENYHFVLFTAYIPTPVIISKPFLTLQITNAMQVSKWICSEMPRCLHLNPQNSFVWLQLLVIWLERFLKWGLRGWAHQQCYISDLRRIRATVPSHCVWCLLKRLQRFLRTRNLVLLYVPLEDFMTPQDTLERITRISEHHRTNYRQRRKI